MRTLRRHRSGRSPAVRWELQRLSHLARGTNDRFTRPHLHFWADTADGVRLAGTLLGSPQTSKTAIVLVHGFMGYRQKRPWRFLAESLSKHFAVLTFDLRGHGQSTGACSGGQFEHLDVQAVVDNARARGFERVITVGGSLGGIAVLSHAALGSGIDAVVAISTPARWGASDTKAVRRATWLFLSPMGRALARRLMGTTIDLVWGNPAPPLELIERISPTPVLLIHGADDHFFAASEAELLYERAREPKRLVIVPRFGHAEDGFTAAFAEQLSQEISTLVPHKA
ncbi:MAG: alpha/beta hydrolase [Actinomycetota bacterium]